MHVCALKDANTSILYIDQHFLHEVTSPIALDTLVRKSLPVRRSESILAVTDHNITTFVNRNDDSAIEVKTL